METLREIASQANQDYYNYKSEYYDYCRPDCHVQKKIAKHTNAIARFSKWLLQDEVAGSSNLAEAARDAQVLTRERATNFLDESQHKLNFRLWEADQHVSAAVNKGHDFYIAHQPELNRLALIDAELDGVLVNFGPDSVATR